MTDSAARRVVCLGEILIDLIAPWDTDLAGADQLAVREGGAPMNAAVAMARLGVPVRFCGVVGEDPFGSRLRALLEEEGIDTSSLRATSEASTSVAFAWKDEDGDGHFQLLRLADRTLAVADLKTAAIETAEAILVGSVALSDQPSRKAIVEAVRRATVAGVPVIVDVNVRPTLWPNRAAALRACAPLLKAARVLKMSLDDARYLWDVDTLDEAVAKAMTLESWLVVITDGARGVALATAEGFGIRRFPVLEVEAIDPTGAGDAFTGGLVARLVASGWSVPGDNDVRFAMAAGALATTKQGAIPALPDRRALEAFLATRS